MSAMIVRTDPDGVRGMNPANRSPGSGVTMAAVTRKTIPMETTSQTSTRSTTR